MQTVRLLLNVRLPEAAHEVEIRVRGHERIISPVGQTWDSFFLNGPRVSDDFLPARVATPSAAMPGSVVSDLSDLNVCLMVAPECHDCNGFHLCGKRHVTQNTA